jgi:hypothetical protein
MPLKNLLVLSNASLNLHVIGSMKGPGLGGWGMRMRVRVIERKVSKAATAVPKSWAIKRT